MFRKAYLVEFQKLLKKKEWKKAKTQEQIMREMGFLCIIKPEKKAQEFAENWARYVTSTLKAEAEAEKEEKTKGAA